MQYLLGLVVLGLLPVLGFVVGVKLANSKSVTRDDRKELTAARNFISDLHDQAAQHVGLGDPFAAIVTDMLRDYRKSLPR